METHAVKVIARIRSDFPEKFGIPRQSGLVPELRDVKEIKADVKTITQKGGKRWDAMIDRVLYVLIGAVISLLMTGGSV